MTRSRYDFDDTGGVLPFEPVRDTKVFVFIGEFFNSLLNQIQYNNPLVACLGTELVMDDSSLVCNVVQM